MLLSLSPIFVMILSAFLFHEKITLKKVGCTALAIAGCILVSGVLQSGGVWNLMGMALGLCAALFYGLYSVISKGAMQRGYHTFTVLFYSLLIAAIVMVPLVDWSLFGTYLQAAPAAHVGFMVLHSLCNSILPYLLYTWSLNHIEVGKVSVITAGGEPSAAMIFGLLVLESSRHFYRLQDFVLQLLHYRCSVRRRKNNFGEVILLWNIGSCLVAEKRSAL